MSARDTRQGSGASGRPGLKVRVERVVPGGLGLARDRDGVLFVRGALVGETVALGAITRRRGTRFADVARIVERSPDRVAPDCEHHPRCGGCDWLAFSPAAEAQGKQAMVEDALGRLAREPIDERVAPIVAPPLGPGARRRCRVQLRPDGATGFFTRGSATSIAIAACPALSPALEAARSRLANAAITGSPARIRLAVDDRDHVCAAVQTTPAARRDALVAQLVEAGIVDGALALDEAGDVAVTHGDPTLRGEVAPGVAGGPYGSDAAVFTQATRAGGQAIIDATLAGLELAGYRGGPLLELFAGAGHLTLVLAARADRVDAVEGAAHSLRWLADNIALSDCGDRVTPRRDTIDGAAFADGLDDRYEAIVLDPPRVGCRDLGAIVRCTRARIVVMVSCDLATGCREIVTLRDAGYRRLRTQPIDAFPRTSHVEWVTTFELKS